MYDRILARRLERTLHSGSSVALAFLDIKGAYDNVPQDSLQLASVRLGVLQPIRSYLRSLYQQSRSRLSYGGQIVTDEIAAGGVKQGAPSSCALFYAVMDLVTKSIQANMGAEIAKGVRVSNLLCADESCCKRV